MVNSSDPGGYNEADPENTYTADDDPINGRQSDTSSSRSGIMTGLRHQGAAAVLWLSARWRNAVAESRGISDGHQNPFSGDNLSLSDYISPGPSYPDTKEAVRRRSMKDFYRSGSVLTKERVMKSPKTATQRPGFQLPAPVWI